MYQRYFRFSTDLYSSAYLMQYFKAEFIIVIIIFGLFVDYFWFDRHVSFCCLIQCPSQFFLIFYSLLCQNFSLFLLSRSKSANQQVAISSTNSRYKNLLGRDSSLDRGMTFEVARHFPRKLGGFLDLRRCSALETEGAMVILWKASSKIKSFVNAQDRKAKLEACRRHTKRVIPSTPPPRQGRWAQTSLQTWCLPPHHKREVRAEIHIHQFSPTVYGQTPSEPSPYHRSTFVCTSAGACARTKIQE